MTPVKPRRRGGRQTVHSRLQTEVYKRLKAYTAQTGSQDSAVINTALAQYLDKTSDTALILRRLDRIGRRLARAHREMEVLSEVTTTFIQLYFAHTPALSADDRKAAQQSALKRFAEMIDFVRKRLGGPKRFLVDLLGPEDHDQDQPLQVSQANGSGDDRPE
jgi:predicted DNA-binding protein